MAVHNLGLYVYQYKLESFVTFINDIRKLYHSTNKIVHSPEKMFISNYICSYLIDHIWSENKNRLVWPYTIIHAQMFMYGSNILIIIKNMRKK